MKKSKDLSVKDYQKKKERFQKRSCERYYDLLRLTAQKKYKNIASKIFVLDKYKIIFLRFHFLS